MLLKRAITKIYIIFNLALRLDFMDQMETYQQCLEVIGTIKEKICIQPVCENTC